MDVICLSDDDLALAEQVGLKRHNWNYGKRPQRLAAAGERYTSKQAALTSDILGSAGELAALRFLGLPLSAWHAYAEADPHTIRGDVGDWEVRTRPPRWPNLIIHPSDQGPTILVLARSPHFEICGWIDAQQCKRREFWLTPPDVPMAAYFVPPDRLTQFEPQHVGTARIAPQT